MAKQKKKEDIVDAIKIEAPRIESIKVRINGDALLQNPRTQRIIDEIANKQTSTGVKKNTKEVRDPEAEYQEKLDARTLDNGAFWFPAIAIKKSIVAAGGRFTGYAMTELRGMFRIVEQEVPLKCRQVRNRRDSGSPQGKGKLFIIYRPEYLDWKMEFRIDYNSALITSENLANLMALAGSSIGLGAWRMESNGNHGAFVIDSISIVKGVKKAA